MYWFKADKRAEFQKDKTIKELAKKINVSEPYFYNVINNKLGCSSRMAYMMANIIGKKNIEYYFEVKED